MIPSGFRASYGPPRSAGGNRCGFRMALRQRPYRDFLDPLLLPGNLLAGGLSNPKAYLWDNLPQPKGGGDGERSAEEADREAAVEEITGRK